jgi:DNA-binding beta-propeller fold protein YncE
MTKPFVLGLLALASGCTGQSDPCDGATAGDACLWAGTGTKGFNASNPNLPRLESQIYFPSDLTFGADGRAYIADFNNHRIRRVDRTDNMVTILGTDYEGDGPPEMEDRLPVCNPQGSLGTLVAMNHPTDIKVGPDGLVYVAAWHNNKIRVVDPDTTMTFTLTGDTYGFSGDGGNACGALMNQPKTLVFGPDDSIYTVDQRNARVRKLSPGALDSKIVTTIAGMGELGNGGDGGPAVDAQFGFEMTQTPRPSGALAIADNFLYIADSLNHRIRRVDLTTGMIDCIAGGSAEPGYSGDGGQAIAAQFNFPSDLELGPDGRLYVADRYNHVIRAIDLTSGLIETVVGTGQTCDTETTGCPDRTTAKAMELNEPYGLAFDPAGDMYIADTHNSRIMKVLQ